MVLSCHFHTLDIRVIILFVLPLPFCTLLPLSPAPVLFLLSWPGLAAFLELDTPFPPIRYNLLRIFFNSIYLFIFILGYISLLHFYQYLVLSVLIQNSPIYTTHLPVITLVTACIMSQSVTPLTTLVTACNNTV